MKKFFILFFLALFCANTTTADLKQFNQSDFKVNDMQNLFNTAVEKIKPEFNLDNYLKFQKYFVLAFFGYKIFRNFVGYCKYLSAIKKVELDNQRFEILYRAYKKNSSDQKIGKDAIKSIFQFMYSPSMLAKHLKRIEYKRRREWNRLMEIPKDIFKIDQYMLISLNNYCCFNLTLNKDFKIKQSDILNLLITNIIFFKIIHRLIKAQNNVALASGGLFNINIMFSLTNLYSNYYEEYLLKHYNIKL